MEQLTLCSLFDGSGGFCLGGLMAGIKPVSCSEIEPFPIRVTTKRLPFVKHYGDVSKINGAEIGPVDIITFGSPCQNLSIAGKREGLCGDRSSLFYQAIRIVKEMRCATNGEYPRYIVWENVEGARTSNAGEDFRCVLEEICKIKDREFSVPQPPKGKWSGAGEIVGDDFSLAWRILDAQHWGVAQRRKRIYLVADFAGGSAGKILFESEGVSGYSAESFASWQRAARNSEACLGAAGGICLNDQGGGRMYVSHDVTATLRAQEHGHQPCVLAAGFCPEQSAKTRGIGYEEAVSPTLRVGAVPATVYENHSQDTRYIGPLDIAPTVCAMTTGSYMQVEEETAPTLMARDFKDPTVVAYGIGRDAFNQGLNAKFKPSVEKELQPTLVAKGPGAVQCGYTVRRLTPTECARLQGFPDWWCADLGTESPTDEDIAFWREVFETHRQLMGTSPKPKTDKQITKWLKDPHTDAAEYKMWGNGVCLNIVVMLMYGIKWAADQDFS